MMKQSVGEGSFMATELTVEQQLLQQRARRSFLATRMPALMCVFRSGNGRWGVHFFVPLLARVLKCPARRRLTWGLSSMGGSGC